MSTKLIETLLVLSIPFVILLIIFQPIADYFTEFDDRAKVAMITFKSNGELSCEDAVELYEIRANTLEEKMLLNTNDTITEASKLTITKPTLEEKTSSLVGIVTGWNGLGHNSLDMIDNMIVDIDRCK